MITITRASEVDKSWDRFVEHHPRATVAHLSAWGDDRARGLRARERLPHRRRRRRRGRGRAAAHHVRSRLFGRRLVSMPFLDYGGVLAEPGRGVETALVEAALAVAREAAARTLGLRQFHPEPLPWPDDRGPRDDAARAHHRGGGVEGAAVRAAQPRPQGRASSGSRPRGAGDEALDEFYPVYAVNMRDLGSPVHSRGFFRAMLAALPDTARVLLVRDRDGRAVGAAICLFFRDTIMVPWVSSLREAFALCPNFVLYWEVIRLGCRRATARSTSAARSGTPGRSSSSASGAPSPTAAVALHRRPARRAALGGPRRQPLRPHGPRVEAAADAGGQHARAVDPPAGAELRCWSRSRS